MRRIDFESVAWVNAGAGMRGKSLESGGTIVRLLELPTGTRETEWCRRGHVGYVLSGRLKVEFDDGVEVYSPNDALVIEADVRHRAHAVEGPVRLFLVEESTVDTSRGDGT